RATAVSSRTPKAAAMSGLVQPESVSRMARARSASARSRDRPSSAKARLCSSFAETGDLPAMIRTPAQIGAGNHRPQSVGQTGRTCLAAALPGGSEVEKLAPLAVEAQAS